MRNRLFPLFLMACALLMSACLSERKDDGHTDLPEVTDEPSPAAREAAGRVDSDSKDGGEPMFEANNEDQRVVKSKEQWRKELTPEQYRVMREAGTERAFTGKYWDTKTPGVYQCAGCGQKLYASETKFDSGCGWPSFYAAADENVIEMKPDRSHGMVRTELRCSRCGSHLGHVFDDGPQPTGQRHCINSASLDLIPSEETSE